MTATNVVALPGTAAYRLALQGFRVFPLRKGRKLPLKKGWQAWASSDPFFILNNWPGDAPPGVATGPDFTVIDVEAAGLECDVAALQLPPTYTVRTARGGLHFYYRTPAGMSFACSTKKIAPLTDVKATGGLTCGPGAYFIDPKTGVRGEYTIEKDLPIVELPPHLIEKLIAAPQKAPNAGQIVGDLDTAHALQRAAAYLADTSERGPPRDVLPGSRGTMAYRVAARLGDFGVSVETAYEMMQPWNTSACTPPQDDDEFARCVEHAYQYRQDPIGRDNPLAHFSEVASRDASDLLEFPSDIRLEEILERERNALVRGILHAGEQGCIYGAPGAAKSFLGIDLGFHVGLGKPWHGRRVTRAPVVYVCLEGVSGFRKRMLAATQRIGDPGRFFARLKIHISLVKESAGMDGANKIVEAAKALAASCGQPVGAIIIDTLARAVPGADENSVADMMAYLENRAGYIARETAAAVITIHHENAAGGMRGSTSLPAGFDAILRIDRNDTIRTVIGQKIKDDDEGPLFGFDLEKVELGTDDEGIPVSSCVVREVVAKPGAATKPSEMTKTERAWREGFEALRSTGKLENCAATDGMRMGVAAELDDLQKEFIARYGTRDPGRQWRRAIATPPSGFEIIRIKGREIVWCPI